MRTPDNINYDRPRNNWGINRYVWVWRRHVATSHKSSFRRKIHFYIKNKMAFDFFVTNRTLVTTELKRNFHPLSLLITKFRPCSYQSAVIDAQWQGQDRVEFKISLTSPALRLVIIESNDVESNESFCWVEWVITDGGIARGFCDFILHSPWVGELPEYM